MTIHSLKANTDSPDPTEHDARFEDFICKIHSLVSQLHQHGKLSPERISSQLWDLAAAVKHIAEQYAVDRLSHRAVYNLDLECNDLPMNTSETRNLTGSEDYAGLG
jgi:hypothetical protein